MQAGLAYPDSPTIVQKIQGLAEYILANVENARQRGVIVGGDARHNSEQSSRLATAVLVAKGIKVYRYGGIPNHTPLVPFGVKFLNAAAGLITTADDVHKVYLSGGCQITSSVDAEIGAYIGQNLELIDIDEDTLDSSILVERELGHVYEAYIRAVVAAATRYYQADFEQPPLPFVYTPMYGVGLPFLESIVAELKILGMTVVPQQASSDPDIPNLKVPDLEERGALDLAIETANTAGIDLILANDPSADLLTVAEKVQGRWHQFTGNQLGVLLAAHIFETYPRDAEHPLDKLALLVSLVSSKMLRYMCREEGVFYEETLSGFAWLGNRVLDLEAEGYDVQLAYEELGYMAPAVVHDKDGIAAAALFITAAQRWRAEGLTPWAKLQKLYDQYGYWAEAHTYLTSPSAAVTKQVFADLRKGIDYETIGTKRHKGFQFGHRRINWWGDLTEGFDSHAPDHKSDLPIDKSKEMISLMSEGRIWATMWASATEPKIKIYVNARGDNEKEAQWRADQMCEAIIHEWFQPKKYGLQLAHIERYPW